MRQIEDEEAFALRQFTPKIASGVIMCTHLYIKYPILIQVIEYLRNYLL